MCEEQVMAQACSIVGAHVCSIAIRLDSGATEWVSPAARDLDWPAEEGELRQSAADQV